MTTRLNVLSRVLLLVLLSLSLMTCSDLFKTDENEDDGGPTRVLVDAEDGGTVTSPDNLMTLTIPPNALNEDTIIEIAVVPASDYPDELSGEHLVSKVYKLGPDSLQLTKPAEVEVDLEEADVGASFADGEYPLIGGVMLSSGGDFEGMDSSTVEYDSIEETITYSGQIDHFSFIYQFEGIYTYDPFTYRGTVIFEAYVGPEVAWVGEEHTAGFGFRNATDVDLYVEVHNDELWPVGWTGVITAFDVAAGNGVSRDITPKWSCVSTGDGQAFLMVYASISNPEIEFAGQSMLFRHQVECLAEDPQPTNCGDEKLKHVMGGFFFKFFDKEPCSEVKDPEGDGTVKNSWGLIHDITRSMVSTYGWGVLRQDITKEEWDDIQNTYEFIPWELWIGPPQFDAGGPSGMTSTDDHLVFFNVMWDTIPIADPEYYYQYGFVFDRDGDTENNYEPHPSYPYDFFQDTDYWIVASYDPVAGWTLGATDATDSSPASVESEARMIVVGNTLILIVPRVEFLADSIGYRMSAYRHPGDWGTGGDWDGDVQPPVADGLKWIDVGGD